VHQNGHFKKFTDMAVGDKLTFWVSENRMEAKELPASTARFWTVLPPK
jgi:hypothetical protein